jgi:hypothetical protein
MATDISGWFRREGMITGSFGWYAAASARDHVLMRPAGAELHN